MARPALAEFPSERNRNLGAGTAPIDEIVTDENPVHVGIVFHVSVIWASVFATVVGIRLIPPMGRLVPVVDVVAESPANAGVHIGTLVPEAGIPPVFVEHHGFAYTHGVDHVPVSFLPLGSGSHDPIVDGGLPAYLRFACRQRAETVKRVRSEPVISCHYICIEFRHWVILIGKLVEWRGNRTSTRPSCTMCWTRR